MAPALIDEDEQYKSSEDSDFAPDAAPAHESGASDSEDDGAQDQEPPSKRQRTAAAAAAAAAKTKEDGDAGYDNSGDEAIIEKGTRRRKRDKAKGAAIDDDDEGGEGGLVKTRRQRAQEKEERKTAVNTGPVTIDVDAVWAQMLAGNTHKPTTSTDANTTEAAAAAPAAPSSSEPKPADTEDSNLVRIKRTYNYAGRVHSEEKLVLRDSAEAKLYFQSQGKEVPSADGSAAAARTTKKAFRSRFEPVAAGADSPLRRADLNLGMAARTQAGRDAAAKKLNTVEKSRMDWAGFVDKEGIKDDLELAGRSKDSYASRQDFLARVDAKRDDDARRARMAARA